MNSFPAELIYGLVFAAILLFQYLMKRFGPQEQLPEIPEDLMETETPTASSVFSGDASHFGRTGTSRASASPPTPPRRRFSRRSLMGTRRDMQNAIVIAAILGPCRAFEPHDIRNHR